MSVVLDEYQNALIAGMECFGKRDYDQAIDKLSRAIELKPDVANAYGLRSISYSLKGNHELAIADAEMALKIEPDKSEHRDHLDNVKKEAEKEPERIERKQAIDSATGELRVNPKSASAYYKRGMAYNGQYIDSLTKHLVSGGVFKPSEEAENLKNAAFKDLEEAVKLEPDNDTYRETLETMRIKSGLCRYCGGKVGGLFQKKCKSCGKKQ